MGSETYQSPFSWRYGSDAMRQIWSESNKHLTWRRVWIALAQGQMDYGLVTPSQVVELIAHQDEIDLEQCSRIEAEIHHDLMAEVKVFASQCPSAGGILHLGATSMDIEDNTDILRLKQALALILDELRGMLSTLAGLIAEHARTTVMAFTHLQPAESTTLGYRLAFYGQDLLEDYLSLRSITNNLKGKGFKGAVGTRASYCELIGKDNLDEFEARISKQLGLGFFEITSQTYPRRQDYILMSGLAGLGATLYKMAFDMRFLQTPSIGELTEPFSEKQVGSSAMPFKRNPIRSEKIDSLGRLLAQFPRVAWDNAAHSLLERTLDDSANRRSLLPEACLAAEEMVMTARTIFDGLTLNLPAINKDLSIYGPFAGTERVMMAAVKKGADRQAMHELLRHHAMQVWQVVQRGDPNPLADRLVSDPDITRYLKPDEIMALLQAENHVGDAPERALAISARIKETIAA